MVEGGADELVHRVLRVIHALPRLERAHAEQREERDAQQPAYL